MNVVVVVVVKSNFGDMNHFIFPLGTPIALAYQCRCRKMVNCRNGMFRHKAKYLAAEKQFAHNFVQTEV